MKKIKLLLIALTFFLCTVGIASAAVVDVWDDSNATFAWINFGGSGPDVSNIFKLDLPTTSNSTFSYNSSLVDVFTITLNGRYATYSETIDLFLRDEDDSSKWYDIGGYWQNSTNWWESFSHTWDIKSSGFDLSLFDGDSYFEVAYGCHFKHVDTSVHIEQSSNPVPEPTTILLMGIGLMGIAGYGRKKFKK